MKKTNRRYLLLSAAATAAALFCTTHSGYAQTLTWDASQAVPPGDGNGNWDTGDSNWYNGTAAVPWVSGDTAILGNVAGNDATAGGTSNAIQLTSSIVVQDINFADANNNPSTAGPGFYSLLDDGNGENLTINGNITKSTAVGESAIGLTGSVILPAGNHVIAINDTPGAVPELSMDTPMTGAGSVTLNNAAQGYAQYGTFVANVDSNYTGGTSIQSGALTQNSQAGLGTGTVTISNQGILEFGGNGTTQPATMNITEPIVITRNTYTGNNFSDYTDALAAQNPGNGHTSVVTLNGPVDIDSNDAQVGAYTSNLIIASNLSTDITNPLLALDGDFSGFVTLSGNNTAFAAAGGTIQIGSDVELNASSLANIGGPTGNLTFTGGGDFHPVGGFITSFGSLNVNYGTFNGGLDIDSGNSFTVSQNLGTVGNTNGSLGMRGAGTLTISGTDNLGGETFWDGWSAAPNGSTTTGGVVNITGTVALGSIHLRSPTVNITGAFTVNDPNGGQYNAIGESAGGTNGGPDKAIVNITGNGSFTETTGDDFNVSNDTNTQGTINISGNGALTTGGITWLAKSAGAVGTINQNGGTFTINRSGNFGFVIADGRNINGTPTGNYNLNSGIFNDENGEIYVGEGANGGGHGVGNWTQTGGTATFGNWFVVGREGAQGTVLISGGSLTKDTSNGGANVSIGEGGSNVCTLTVDNTGSFNIESGQVFVGNNSSVGIANLGSPTDPVNAAPSLTVNNWFAIGRNGTSNGTLNVYDGTLTVNDIPGGNNQNWFDVGGDGGSATGTVNVNGGTVTTNGIWIGENGSCTGTFNMNGGTATLGIVELALNDSATGTINLNGGSLSASSITAQNGGGTGVAELFYNGGVLTTTPADVQNNFVGAKVTSVVSTGGAIINANGGYININSALTHNSALTGVDGGLTVTGTGTVQLGTPGSHSPINTYTGPTKVQGGTLIVSTTGSLPTNTAVAITNGTLQLGTSTGQATLASLAITGNGTFDVTNNHVIINYGNGADPVSSIAALLKAGYNGGAWNGAGGIVTSAPLVVGGLTYGLGYADGDDAQRLATGLASGTIEVKYTLLGDADLNGIVNGIDFGILAANFNKGITGWDEGDFDYNNIVNGLDFGDLAANFNKGAAGTDAVAALDAFAAANGLLADVPEPASLGLLTVGTVGLLARRRRRAAKL